MATLTIEDKIEELRLKMIEEAHRQGCLLHENVVAISQELDECLLSYQKMGQLQRALLA